METNNQQPFNGSALSHDKGLARFYAVLWLVLFTAFAPILAHAVDTVCARVKIEIKQEMTLERQAFDAQMKINNATTDGVIQNVAVDVKVTDENGVPVAVTDDPNDTSAKFFIRVSSKQDISDITGAGTVNPQTSAIINWLLIPASGSAGDTPFGKKYRVGATLKYTFAGEDTVLDVSPDIITVKPLPMLTLDYFLTQNVWADDPLTAEIEPVEPFTLGVRVKNDGQNTAKNLKIDSAQPKIIENNQGLLINFLLTGSYVNDAPVQNTLLIDFGDIAAGSSKMGRWLMETSLAGKFTEFTARFSHADELGGALTSVIKETNAHFLIHDVRVDLPGRDAVRDFLAQDGDVIRIYESDGPDTVVTDRSAVATLTAVSTSADGAGYRLDAPATAGFMYAKLPDPFNGQKVLGSILRSDAKLMAPDNVWLSKTRNEQTKQWQYWVNFFDVNTSGSYDAEFREPPESALAPVIQFIPDRLVQETQQVSFLVEASSPQGKAVTIAAAALPQGATFTMQPADPLAPGLARAVFDWTPAAGQIGDYPIVYTASDGELNSKLTANIKVETFTPPPGPETPSIVIPLSGAQVTSLTPTLSVQTSIDPSDPTAQVQFEVYADEALTQLVATSQIDKMPPIDIDGTGPVPQPTAWTLPVELTDNTHYWWRARAYDGTVYSLWTNAHFFVNLFNDPPDSFNLIHPDSDAEVASLTPTFTWNNSSDKDGDAITYEVTIYGDAGLIDIVAQALDLVEDAGGSTSWTATVPLSNHGIYYWNVVAKDALGAQTASFTRPFVVNTGNTAPTDPVILSPEKGGQSIDVSTELKIQNSLDADHDPVTYVFEIDTVNTFDSPAKESSNVVFEGMGGTTSWFTGPLVENQHYWWRAKAQDGRADSAWVVGDFLMNESNDPPAAPTIKNPGDGAWSSVLQPILEANPVSDPEGEAVRYQFEVYQGAPPQQKVAEGILTAATFIPPMPLIDKTTYSWRVRALDEQDDASDWSPVAVLYVSTGPYQAPTIAVTTPSTPIAPVSVSTPTGTRKQVTIDWEGVAPNIEPTIALYYDSQQSGFAGTLIVDGITQSAGTQTGSYVWDVTDLPAGTYYIYATINDAGGMGRAYGPGAVVIPSQPQAGSIVVTENNYLYTSEGGATAKFKIRLGTAPTANVIVPLSSTNNGEGTVAPASLTFTPQNWSADQAVTVTGVNDCAPDGNIVYQVLSGKAVSTDPNYIDLTGTQANLTNLDNFDLAGTSDNPNLHICGMAIVTERQISYNLWEYTLSAQLTNTGASASGVIAKLDQTSSGLLGSLIDILLQLLSGLQVIEDTLIFGQAKQGETIGSDDTIVVRSSRRMSASEFNGLKWKVTILP
ncbi:MAG: hypothetical protein M8364_15075 [Methylobacter sp.]|uniref:hypothetical protein n=1 Tax=Methylobacter sp. TaxID=2051955 RepID=UPI0025858D42|nr:hypothetical protein [Methylobacter sp.]MCL7422219.1 hypothetical protein [Methylobacter sp.]